MTDARPLRAIDLYAGVGGWALGAAMAGIEVIRSYEWWDQAAETHRANLRGDVVVADVRSIPNEDFPHDVDVVVGSPPCTEFSFSNRGGRGDIGEGLKDMEKFLDVVRHVQPTFWAMENVPRAAAILAKEILPGGSLARFADLVTVIEVVNASEWGVPQRRRRMIAGNFDLGLLHSYRGVWPQISLGDVIAQLDVGSLDPVYRWPVGRVTDHLRESPLTTEETRMNRDQKAFHRIYNRMSFPEALDRPSRTVTALCTRVSRESIVVAEGEGFRRLTVRERASLQSFPVAYQFQGPRYTDRIKMIGNAIPPLLTFNIAHAMLGTTPSDLRLPSASPLSTHPIESAVPAERRRSYPVTRSFASSIPGLRFGSGMRFELANHVTATGTVSWQTAFFFGPSKGFRTVPLGDRFLHGAERMLDGSLALCVVKTSFELAGRLGRFTQDAAELQSRWRASDMADGPFAVVDALGDTTSQAVTWLSSFSQQELLDALCGMARIDRDEMATSGALRKVRDNVAAVVAGGIVCSLFNADFGLATPRSLRGCR